MDENKFLQKLSQNLLEMLNDEEYYDIIIEVGNNPHVKFFHAHMVILYYRSPYLKRILSINKKKSDDNLVHIKLPNISPEIFQIILRYIYGEKLSLKEYDTIEIIKILDAASELLLQELVLCLQSFLIENRASCISNIQNINLQMSEIQVWEHVLKWGLAQHPELPSDPTSYSKDDFKILKNTLQEWIPFIKFSNLTPKEFLNNVLPYKDILPEGLYIDLLKFFLNSNYSPTKEMFTLKSKIIKYKHVEIISKWIDRLDNKDELISPYKFKLLFRGSRDGLGRKNFHKICDYHSQTVTIVKVKNSKEIIGGYNPVEWRSYGGDSITKDSFIFSFNINNDGSESNILSRVMTEYNAILNGSFNGPTFGNGDLIIFGFSGNCSIQKSYEKQIRRDMYFDIEECEVFEIF